MIHLNFIPYVCFTQPGAVIISILTLLGLQSRFGDNLGQNTWNLTVVSPKRDWSSKRVNRRHLFVDNARGWKLQASIFFIRKIWKLYPAARCTRYQLLTLLAPQSHMWGQSTQNIRSLPPKRDWGPKRVNTLYAHVLGEKRHPISLHYYCCGHNYRAPFYLIFIYKSSLCIGTEWWYNTWQYFALGSINSAVCSPLWGINRSNLQVFCSRNWVAVLEGWGEVQASPAPRVYNSSIIVVAERAGY